TLLPWIFEKIQTLGTAACPPYHLAIAIGGMSSVRALDTSNLASARYLDALLTEGSRLGNGFRDVELEQEVLRLAQTTRIRAPVRGNTLSHDTLPRTLATRGA